MCPVLTFAHSICSMFLKSGSFHLLLNYSQMTLNSYFPQHILILSPFLPPNQTLIYKESFGSSIENTMPVFPLSF
jgi:hypothetical protein